MYNFRSLDLNSLVSANQVINLIDKYLADDKISYDDKLHFDMIKKMVIEQVNSLKLVHPDGFIFYNFNISKLNKLPIERIHPLQFNKFNQFTDTLNKNRYYKLASNKINHKKDGRGRPRGNSDSFKSKLFNLLQEKYGSNPFATKDAVDSYQKVDNKKYNSITAMFSVYEKENRLQHISRGFFQIIN